MNPIKKAYESFDAFMMYAANKAVHAWNWTTGGTKADLASITAGVWSTSFIGAFAILDPSSLVYTLPTLYIAYLINEANHIMEKKETDALLNMAKDVVVEDQKNTIN